MNVKIQENIEKTGMNLYELMAKEKPSIFRNEFWLGKMMSFCIQNEEFKTEMFRFVDVYPSLTDNVSIAQHLKEYFCRPDVKIPATMQWGLKLLKPNSIAAKMIAKKMRKNIENLGHQFIVGETISDAIPYIKEFRDQGIAVTMSVLGELVLSNKDEDEYARKIVELIEKATLIQNDWPVLGTVDNSLDWGITPKVNVSIKISSLYSQSYNMECSFNYTVDYIKERLRIILRKAKELNAFIMLDVEHREWRSITYETYKSLLDEEEFIEYPHTGIVFQTYYRDSERELENLIAWGKKRKSKFSIRLVKGGLWDEEVVHALQKTHSIPVFTNKNETDAVFEKLARKVLKNSEKINLAVGSHNIRSVAAVIEIAKELKVSLDKIEFQLLNGMAENMRKAFVKAGLNVRIYAPIGDIIPGMAYLVRRLMDNTANHSFLKEDTFGNLTKKDMLKNPADTLLKDNNVKKEPLKKDSKSHGNKFKNEPSFQYNSENIKKFTEELKKSRASLPVTVPLVIDGKEIKALINQQTFNPNKIAEIIGKISGASRENLESAIDSANVAFQKWKITDNELRLKFLNKTSDFIKIKRNELASMLIYEVGMTWSEAQKEVDDAIDLIKYYIHNFQLLCVEKKINDVRGENNRILYEARGISFILSSHNSPLSKPIGLIMAAIMMGNSVIFSPSKNVSVTGYKIYQIFNLTNIPKGTLNFIPNISEDFVEIISNNEKIKIIAYSGRREGLRQLSRLTINNFNEYFSKKIINYSVTGNNAIIVDSDADIDNALKHIVRSVFSYQGQKSSSCSRLLVLEDIHEILNERLINVVKSINYGPTENPKNLIGAVINEKEKIRYDKIVNRLKNEGNTLIERKYNENHEAGYFAPIVIINDIAPTSTILQEEIIGPVVCVTKVKDFEEAINVANNFGYTSTISVYSRSPLNIQKASKELCVGHLFINQNTCDGFIGRQDYGGYDPSGIGIKTEVKDFLKELIIMKTITENTIRKGYSP